MKSALHVLVWIAATGVSLLSSQGVVAQVQSSQEVVSAEPVPCPRSLADLLAFSLENLARVDIARVNLICAEGLPGSERIKTDEFFANWMCGRYT